MHTHTYSRVWGGVSSRITCHQLEAGQSKVTSFSMQTPAHRLHSRTQGLVAHLWHTHSWTQARKPFSSWSKSNHSRSPGSQHWGELAEDAVSFTSFKSNCCCSLLLPVPKHYSKPKLKLHFWINNESRKINHICPGNEPKTRAVTPRNLWAELRVNFNSEGNEPLRRKFK